MDLNDSAAHNRQGGRHAATLPVVSPATDAVGIRCGLSFDTRPPGSHDGYRPTLRGADPMRVFDVRPYGANQWAIIEEGRGMVATDIDLRDDRDVETIMRQKAAKEGLILNFIRGEDGRIRRIEARDAVNLNLSVTPEFDRVLLDLAGAMEVGKADVIFRAVALLKAALEAKARGKAVGAADLPDVLETEFVGF